MPGLKLDRLHTWLHTNCSTIAEADVDVNIQIQE